MFITLAGEAGAAFGDVDPMAAAAAPSSSRGGWVGWFGGRSSGSSSRNLIVELQHEVSILRHVARREWIRRGNGAIATRL